MKIILKKLIVDQNRHYKKSKTKTKIKKKNEKNKNRNKLIFLTIFFHSGPKLL